MHPNAKARILAATDTESVATGVSRGHAVRGLKNKFTDKFLALEEQGAPQAELDTLATGTNRLAAVDGDVENGLVQVGQSLVPLKEVKPVRDVIQGIITEAGDKLANAAKILA